MRRRSSRTYAYQHSRYGGDRGGECTGDRGGGRGYRRKCPGYTGGNTYRYAVAYEYPRSNEHAVADFDTDADEHA